MFLIVATNPVMLSLKWSWEGEGDIEKHMKMMKH